MSAIRLARGYTGKKVVVKFDGCYHGHADSFLVKAGSGLITLGIPGSPGVPEDIVKNTVSIPYNNPVLATRVSQEKAEHILRVLPDFQYSSEGQMLYFRPTDFDPVKRRVV